MNVSGARLEAVKCAEDTQNMIVRLSGNGETVSEFSVSPLKAAVAAFLCDINENRLSPQSVSDGSVTGSIAPFEVLTVEISFT